ncbi:hypothetical protein NHL50_02520 [Acidimicrobiia bacterium EGI L10123]|uniref:hypothetical protein n=1 Tax=Salinilacustrithrix flava TaxID=2957203 RepID=UPI003D7C1EE8|nr:hypothetical protein [Acidimicrobiia bacterium EGI L10123]
MRATSALPRSVLAVLAGLALVLAGCGDDDDGAVAPADDVLVDDQDDAAEVDPAEPDAAGDEAGDDAVLGWQLTGEPGTVVSLETVAVSDGTEQPSMDQEFTLDEEPTQMLFTVFVDSAEISLAVTAGGPVTAEAIRGRAVDPEDPFAGIEVLEVLDAVEVPADGSEVVLDVG